MKTRFTLLMLFTTLSLAAQDNLQYQTPSDDFVKLVDAPSTPAVLFSPDKSTMAMLNRSDLPGIEELSRPELRIAGLRINPDNFGPSRNNFFTGLKIKKLADKKDEEIAGLPAPLQMSYPSFSPDSKKIAFIQTFVDRLELWLVDLASRQAKKISTHQVNATLGMPYAWVGSGAELVYLGAANEKKEAPAKSRVPRGPVVEENLGKKAPAVTYQDLLKNPYDESLFEFYGASQLLLVAIDGTEKSLGATGIYLSFSPSPDGKLVLTKILQKPFSYLVPAPAFPTTVQVIDLSGQVVKKIADIPLADNVPLGFNATIKGPRAHAWRNDQPATVYWAEAQDGGDPKVKADIRDKVLQWEFPFAGAPVVLISLPLRFSGVTWGNDKTAWVYESWRADRKERVYQIDPTNPGKKKTVFDLSTEDGYNDPGNVVTAANAFGRPAMLIQNNAVFLTGNGASPEGDLPFLDKLDLATGKSTRLWRCQPPYYEWVAALLDAKKLTFVTSRESLSDNPNYFIHVGGDHGTVTQLTQFPHPYPQIKDVKKQVLKYKRDDGVDMTADLYLPPGYKKEDGPLPTFVWAYPAEFKTRSAAGQVKGSPYTFTRINPLGPLFWVLRGYAVLDNASMPIVGEGTAEPNDTYVAQLVSNAKAIVDYATSLGVTDRNRIGVGGHSYGAFMTMNLLAHCDYFKAGIARSGAYNRTLTPFGFQNEQRSYWEAPEVYYNMSPFSFANKINEPVLMIHGEADNNTGTFPIQSERMYNAVKGHGGTARFVLLPYESHGYRGRESVLHTLWEMDNWLEKYVKDATALPEKTKVEMKK